jgi:hypothetical protein
MSLRSFFLAPSYNEDLLTLDNFSTSYQIETSTEKSSGTAEEPLGYDMTCVYEIEQEIFKKEILNTIEMKNINIWSKNKLLKDSLEELKALSQISTLHRVARSMNGEIIDIRNQDTLERDWEKAKSSIIPALYKTHWEREGFITAYEKGLSLKHRTLINNWQYLLMMPEIYKFQHYVNPRNPAKTRIHKHKSELTNPKGIEYVMECNSCTKEKDVLKLSLKSSVTDQSKKLQLKNYTFNIILRYEINARSGKVLKADFRLDERMDNLNYHQVKVNLVEL